MWIPLKKIKSDIPIMTSGSTIGRNESVRMYVRPRNLFQLIPMAANVPSTVAITADTIATTAECRRLCQSPFECAKSSLYHTRENPENDEDSELLNEYRIITKSGTNRKRSERKSTVLEKLKALFLFFQLLLACLFDSVLA